MQRNRGDRPVLRAAGRSPRMVDVRVAARTAAGAGEVGQGRGVVRVAVVLAESLGLSAVLPLKATESTT